MLKKLALPLLSVLAIVSIATGCGSSGSSTTKAEFVKRSEAICEKAHKQQEVNLAIYMKQHPKLLVSKPGQEKAAGPVLLQPIHTEVEELAALDAPSGDEDQVDAIVEGFEKALESSEATPSSLLGGTTSPFAEVGKLARAYGLKICASPS